MPQNRINPPLFTRLAKTVNCRYGNIIGSSKNCQIELLPTPFLSKFILYQLTDFGGIPTIRYRIAYNDSRTILLDGSQNSLTDIIAEEVPLINYATAIAYLKFYISHSCHPIESNKIITDIEDIDFTEFPGDDLLLKITRNIIPPVITYSKNSFTIYCNLILNSTLYQSAIDVHENGRVEIIEKREILKGIPVGEMIFDL